MEGIFRRHWVGDWQTWIGGSDDQLTRTDDDLKRLWGQVFASILPEATAKMGPLVVYDGVNRLVRDGKIELHIRRWERGQQFGFKARYRILGKSRSEFKLLN